MNTLPARELRHGSLKLAALLLPALFVLGCAGGVSGHAPGLAGLQTQDPGTLNFPLAYVKRPAPAPMPKTDIDVRDLITSTPGGDLYIRAQASPGSPEINITQSITLGLGDVRPILRGLSLRRAVCAGDRPGPQRYDPALNDPEPGGTTGQRA